MFELNDKQIAEFFRRSYTAVDGLWFVKAEETCGFDAALDLDDEVWKIFPKVQARMLKDMTRMASECTDPALASKVRIGSPGMKRGIIQSTVTARKNVRA